MKFTLHKARKGNEWGRRKGEKFRDFVLLCINCCKFPSTSEAIQFEKFIFSSLSLFLFLSFSDMSAGPHSTGTRGARRRGDAPTVRNGARVQLAPGLVESRLQMSTKSVAWDPARGLRVAAWLWLSPVRANIDRYFTATLGLDQIAWSYG